MTLSDVNSWIDIISKDFQRCLKNVMGIPDSVITRQNLTSVNIGHITNKITIQPHN